VGLGLTSSPHGGRHVALALVVMTVKAKIITGFIVAFLVFLCWHNPSGTADLAWSAASAVGTLFGKIGTFFSEFAKHWNAS
jgi:hypothetical protein